ncbi:hypothetical protein Hanom_Chr09g00846661 [Helianthus anomalus]
MGQISTALGWWLVKNYDHKTHVLNCGSYQIPITEELMHEIFGVPRGYVEIQEVERARADFIEVVAEWKSQFENTPKPFTPVQFKAYMQKEHASRRIFVLNLLCFYNTLLCETTHSPSINMRFLPTLRQGLDINNFNWCEYIIS